ncbi:MAG: NAD(+)/NADH kinase [Butyribacter sp.]|nr:NAD(+)/NADH kinase [bacterium]MDY3854358.1 NAD(+)/NADH kinase [Butyribacter sp.]
MKHFCIITNSDKDANDSMAEYIVSYLEKRGCTCVVMENRKWQSNGIFHFTDVDKITDDIECAIVLGGDGTMIQAAIDLVHRDLPILGVNTGTLGFLTEVEQNKVDIALERLLAGEYTIESRMMLKECSMFLQKDSRSSCYALNDMVITKRGDCRLITIKVYVNDELADIYRADGLIIATPTGSTGYNLSAGGPVMAPNVHAMVVTPICAHSLNKRSLVLDRSDKLTLEIGQTKEVCEDKAVLTADGRNVGPLATGDVLVIQEPHADTKLIKLSGIEFYERMREKLNGN